MARTSLVLLVFVALAGCGKHTSTKAHTDAAPPTSSAPPPLAVPTVIVESVGIKSFAVDAHEAVYFTEAAGHVRKQEIGKAAVTLASGGAPSTIVVGGGSVYWIDDSGKSFVRKVSASNGGVPAVVGTDEHLKVWGLAATADAVYWATYFTVHRVPFAPNEASTPVASGNGIMEIAVTKTHVATSEVLANEIRVTTTGPSKSVRALSPWKFPSPLAIDDARVYWVSSANDADLVSAPLGDPLPAPPPVVTARLPITIDTNAVYWQSADGTLKRQPKNGGSPVVMAKPSKPTTAIAVDGLYLYWSTDAEIARVPKT